MPTPPPPPGPKDPAYINYSEIKNDLAMPGTRPNPQSSGARGYNRLDVKTVGRRHGGSQRTGALQRTLSKLRGTGVLIPRGVFRFTSFEEADAWMTRTMARTHASRKSKISRGSAAALNAAGARYLLIGGFAVIARGGTRTTKDIDLLIDPTPGNVARVKQALRILEDRAIDEVADDDVQRYVVVRVADEVVVDLMAAACGVDYNSAAQDAETLTIDGVAIPVPSLSTLIRMKQTIALQTPPTGCIWNSYSGRSAARSDAASAERDPAVDPKSFRRAMGTLFGPTSTP